MISYYFQTTIFQCSKNYGCPRPSTRVTGLNVSAKMVDPISMKHSVSSLKKKKKKKKNCFMIWGSLNQNVCYDIVTHVYFVGVLVTLYVYFRTDDTHNRQRPC